MRRDISRGRRHEVRKEEREIPISKLRQTVRSATVTLKSAAVHSLGTGASPDAASCARKRYSSRTLLATSRRHASTRLLARIRGDIFCLYACTYVSRSPRALSRRSEPRVESFSCEELKLSIALPQRFFLRRTVSFRKRRSDNTRLCSLPKFIR